MPHDYGACVPQLRKPGGLDPALRNQSSRHGEKPKRRNGEQLPLTAAREKPTQSNKTQHSQKKNGLCNAGDVLSIPDQGTKIPHALGQLSP